MKKYNLIIITLLYCFIAEAQTFIATGKITYERKVNQWGFITGDFSDQFRKSVPQYKTDVFTLSFDGNKSLYQPAGVIAKNFFNAPGSDNVVYSDYSDGQYIAMKNVFEKTFLVRDSVSKIKWKIKDDFREIAGFNCRRATAVVFDSVFVVAFYTDEITLPGGPESFNGLPGTILGLVINRLHTTWYATKVEENTPGENKLAPPQKGVPVSHKDVRKQLETLLLRFGNDAKRMQWAILI